MRRTSTAKTYSIAEAKNLLGHLVHLAEAGERIQLTRRGRLVATVIGTEELSRLETGRRGFPESCQAWRDRYDLASLEIDPSEVFRTVADRSPGKDFSW